MPVVSTNTSGYRTEGTGGYQALAATGTVIANAAAIGALSSTVVVSAADGNKGVILPDGSPGKVVQVVATGNSILKIYPPVNGAIGTGSANAAISVGGGQVAVLVGVGGKNWGCNYTTNGA